MIFKWYSISEYWCSFSLSICLSFPLSPISSAAGFKFRKPNAKSPPSIPGSEYLRAIWPKFKIRFTHPDQWLQSISHVMSYASKGSQAWHWISFPIQGALRWDNRRENAPQTLPVQEEGQTVYERPWGSHLRACWIFKTSCLHQNTTTTVRLFPLLLNN